MEVSKKMHIPLTTWHDKTSVSADEIWRGVLWVVAVPRSDDYIKTLTLISINRRKKSAKILPSNCIILWDVPIRDWADGISIFNQHHEPNELARFYW